MKASKHVRKQLLVIITVILLLVPTGIVSASVGNHTSHSTPSTSSSSRSTPSTSHSTTVNTYHSSSRGSSGGIIGGVIVGIVVVGIIFIVIFAKKKQGGTTVPMIDNSDSIEEQIKQDDELFSAGNFIGWSKEVFMTIQEAWTDRDWAKIRPIEKEELFAVHEKQLAEYKRNGRINVVEYICINSAYLQEYTKDAEFEYLVVNLNSIFNDYIIDENTREVVEGNKNAKYNSVYIMTFCRKIGVKTLASTSELDTKQCPNCGAPLQLTSAGKCEYCDTIVTTGDHDWVLSDYTQLSQSTEN